MSGPSRVAAEIGATTRPHHLRHTWIAAGCLAALAGLALSLGPTIRLPAATDCRLHPRPNLIPTQQTVIATSRGGAPCLIAANNSDYRAEAIRIITSPDNGWLATRGPTRLVYFPNPAFRGEDSFNVELVRRTDTATPLVRPITVRVKVD